MADDYGDFFAAPSDDQPQGGGDEQPIILGAPPPDSDMFGMGEPPQPPPDGGDMGGGDDMGAFLGDVNEAPPILLSDSGDAPIVLGGDVPTEPVQVEPLGPSPMQKWNEEWQQTLLERKDVENNKKAEMLENARVALEKFQQEREAKREAKMAKNREDEQAKLEAIEADLENDNSWQRVCKMVELSHDSSKQASDMKRMRDILISLKNDPPKAEALA